MAETFRATFALLLDPIQLFLARGLTPDPWQAELLRTPAPRILLNCCRQAGKSTAVAALALHTVLSKSDSLVLLLSRAQRQSSELFRKVLDFYRAFDTPFKTVAQSTQHLELQNGGRVISLPGNEENIRSYSGVDLLIIDEAARVPNDLYKAVRPMLAVSNGRLVCLSTPFGKRGFFYDAWTDQAADWLRFEVRANQVPRISQEFLDEELRTLGPTWFNQEYRCSFEAQMGLTYPEFSQCVVEEALAEFRVENQRSWPPVSPLQIPPLKALGGMDFGLRDPFAAVWGVHDRRDDVLWITGEHYARDQALHEIAARLPRGVTWFADPAGARERRELRVADFKIREGDNDLRTGIAAVTARIQTGRLKILGSACPHLLGEFGLYRYPDEDEPALRRDIPVDKDNHALDALRYLVSRLDEKFMIRFRRGVSPETPKKKWLRYDNESLWTELE